MCRGPSLLNSVAAAFCRWQGDPSTPKVWDARTPCSQGTVVLNAPRSRSLRHQTLAAAFIVVLLMIAVGTAMRAW
jgi:hypothetical protein